MNGEAARTWLVKASLLATSSTFVFFFLAPALGFPLAFDEAIRLIEIIVPVFLAYLGSASRYLFVAPPSRLEPGSARLLPLMVKGPVFVFSVAVLAAIVAFGYSNRAEAAPGTGMTLNALTASVSAALGVLTVTTSAIVAGLFGGTEQDEAGREPKRRKGKVRAHEPEPRES